MDASQEKGVTEEAIAAKEDQETRDDAQDEFDGSQAKQTRKEPLKNLVAFYAFGALIYTVYSVIISGAQDILAGTFIPTAAV